MTKWISVQEGMPDTEIECIVATREHDLIYTHKIFAEWDGRRWVDVEGEELKNVIAWVKAPIYNHELRKLIGKLEGCLDKDTCENMDCCYFANQKLIRDLLEYIKE